jgi:hypothetical protein
MERSWGIVLVLLLISITSYAQLSPGTIANNRFLQRVNPAINRALADSGNIYNHSDIQQSAMQMVDLEIWGNLNVWLHGSLIDTFFISPNTKINKSYDISGNNKDFNTWPHIANSEPLYDTIGIDPIYKFTGFSSPVRLLAIVQPTISNTGNYSIVAWAKPSTSFANQSGFFSVKGTSLWSLQFGAAAFNVVANNIAQSINTPDRVVNDWNMYAVSRNGNNYLLKLYNINGTYTYTATFAGSYRGDVSSYIGLRINDNSNTSIANAFNGFLGELRTFNIALNSTQMDAIFQQTKAKYGL